MFADYVTGQCQGTSPFKVIEWGGGARACEAGNGDIVSARWGPTKKDLRAPVKFAH